MIACLIWFVMEHKKTYHLFYVRSTYYYSMHHLSVLPRECHLFSWYLESSFSKWISMRNFIMNVPQTLIFIQNCFSDFRRAKIVGGSSRWAHLVNCVTTLLHGFGFTFSRPSIIMNNEIVENYTLESSSLFSRFHFEWFFYPWSIFEH